MLQCHGIDHLALVTHDMEATVQFYTDLLGMRLVRTMRTGPELNHARHYFFDAGRGNQLAFFDLSEAPPDAMPQHLHHVALTVDSVDTLRAMHQRLLDHGVNATAILERSYGSTFYFQDPNGIRLQLAVQTKAWEGEPYADPDPVPSARALHRS
jgi:catechol 2,3-dioxygenase-like lactoylglutathione lyase family enzyme